MNSFQELVEVCRLKMTLDEYSNKKSMLYEDKLNRAFVINELEKFKVKFKKDMQKFYKMEKING